MPVPFSTPPAAIPARQLVEQIVETLIDLLDRLDGDVDNEPCLGSVGGTAATLVIDQRLWASGTMDDAEHDVADEAHDELSVEA